MQPINLERLIEAGADPNARSKNGRTALMCANPKNSRRLIDAGAEVDMTDTDGRTALFLSTMQAKADALRKAGADPAHRDQRGITPLMYHVGRGDMKMVKWFSRYKKNRGVLDDNGNNALMHAHGSNSVEISEFLAGLGENPHIVNYQGDTLLIRACRSGDLARIRYALSHKPDINAANKAGETGLLIVCRYHDDGLAAKLLIRCGADPFFTGPDGRAAQFKSEEAVRSIRRTIEKKTEARR